MDEKEKETSNAVKTLNEEIKKLQIDIETGKETNKNVDSYASLKDKRQTLELQQAQLQKATCPFDLAPQMERVDTARRKKEEYQTLQRNTARQIEELALLIKHTGPCGIQSFLLEATTKHLVSLVHYLSNDEGFDIQISEREKLVKMYAGNALSALSGGEFQKLSVACFLAYRQLLQNTIGWQSNLLILDEADVYLDESACQSLFDMIKRVGGSTMVISHTNAMHRDMKLFDHHVELERDGHGSRKRRRL